jgi:hypothetical protein
MSDTRKPIEILFDSVPMTPCDPPDEVQEGVPYATHHGKLVLFDLELDCYVLSDGQRVFSGEVIEKLIAGLSEINEPS